MIIKNENQINERLKSSIHVKEMRIININGNQPKKYLRNYIKTAHYNL